MLAEGRRSEPGAICNQDSICLTFAVPQADARALRVCLPEEPGQPCVFETVRI